MKFSHTDDLSPPEPAKQPDFRSLLIAVAILIAVTFAVYGQVVNHEFVSYDDDKFVSENSVVSTGVSTANVIAAFTKADLDNWIPLTWLSHMADVQFYGMSPAGHHLTSVLLHALSAVLLFFLLFRLTGALWRACFVAALFALHPLHVESVAWVAERKDVLSAFFGFLSLLFYTKYVARPNLALYFLTLLLFLCGLLSKPMVVTLPIIMLLLDYWPLGRIVMAKEQPFRLSSLATALRRPILEKIPFLSCSLIIAIVTVRVQSISGAVTSLDMVPVALRLQNALVSYGKYVLKTVWPVDLAFFYPFPPAIPIWQLACSLLVLAATSAAVLRLGRRHPFLPVGWFWFLITLLPVIGLVKVGNQSMADRYSYIPSVGLFIMAAWGVPALTSKMKHRERFLIIIAGAVLAGSLVTTWRQIGYWRDDYHLSQHALQVTSENYVAHSILGIAFAKRGDMQRAVQEYQKSLAINPGHSIASNNLAVAFAVKGDSDAAIKGYRAILLMNPNFFNAHFNLGLALAEKGDVDAATAEFRAALAINPDFLEARSDLGTALMNKGDLDGAITEFRHILRRNPADTEAPVNLALALARKGDLDDAIAAFRQILAREPNNIKARLGLGDAYVDKSEIGAGMKEYQVALALNPTFPGLHNSLGIALATKGDLKEAAEAFREALRLNPLSFEAHRNLGNLLASKGDMKGAEKEFQEARRLPGTSIAPATTK